MNDQQILLVLHLGVSLVMLGMGIPLWRGKVPPNRWYGFRTPSTVRDKNLWYPVNRAAGLWLIRTGVVMGAVTSTTYLMRLAANTAALINLTACAVGLTAMGLHGWLLLRHLKSGRPTERISDDSA